MPSSLALPAAPRAEHGRHNDVLRRQGRVPAVLYGHNVQPQALSVDARTLRRVWRAAGQSNLVDLTLDGGRPRKVLIRELQINPRTTDLVHVDLFAVNLLEKLTVDVPLVPVGESPAVTVDRLGVLQQILTTLKVECLPGDIPAQLSVDVSGLLAVDDGVHVSEVPLPHGVTLASGVNADELVLKIAPLRVAAEEAEGAGEEGAAEEGAAAEAGSEASSQEG